MSHWPMEHRGLQNSYAPYRPGAQLILAGAQSRSQGTGPAACRLGDRPSCGVRTRVHLSGTSLQPRAGRVGILRVCGNCGLPARGPTLPGAQRARSPSTLPLSRGGCHDRPGPRSPSPAHRASALICPDSSPAAAWLLPLPVPRCTRRYHYLPGSRRRAPAGRFRPALRPQDSICPQGR